MEQRLVSKIRVGSDSAQAVGEFVRRKVRQWTLVGYFSGDRDFRLRGRVGRRLALLAWIVGLSCRRHTGEQQNE
jgi:hypothetical protein